MRYLKTDELDDLKNNYNNLDDVTKKLLKTVLYLERRIENYRNSGYELNQSLKSAEQCIFKLQKDIKNIIIDYDSIKNNLNKMKQIMSMSDLYKDEIDKLENYIDANNMVLNINNVQ